MKQESNYETWKSLIIKCIGSCQTEDQFLECGELIKNFDKWFRGENENFQNDLEALWVYLNDEYRDFTSKTSKLIL